MILVSACWEKNFIRINAHKIHMDLHRDIFVYTVEPHQKQVGYNKPRYKKAILPVQALYIFLLSFL